MHVYFDHLNVRYQKCHEILNYTQKKKKKKKKSLNSLIHRPIIFNTFGIKFSANFRKKKKSSYSQKVATIFH